MVLFPVKKVVGLRCLIFLSSEKIPFMRLIVFALFSLAIRVFFGSKPGAVSYHPIRIRICFILPTWKKYRPG